MNQSKKEKLFDYFGENLIKVREMTSEKIFEKTGYKNSATLNSILSVMVQEGNAVKISPGVYKLVSEKQDEVKEVPEKTEEITLIIPIGDKRSVEELEGFISAVEEELLNLDKDEKRLMWSIKQAEEQIEEKKKEKKQKEKEVLIAKKLINNRQSKIKEAAELLKLYFNEKGIKPEDIRENPDVLIENRAV